jgi:hypothetical protein
MAGRIITDPLPDRYRNLSRVVSVDSAKPNAISRRRSGHPIGIFRTYRNNVVHA